MSEQMTWAQVVHATQVTGEHLALLEHYGAFPRHHYDENNCPYWLRPEIDAWLRGKPMEPAPKHAPGAAG